MSICNIILVVTILVNASKQTYPETLAFHVLYHFLDESILAESILRWSHTSLIYFVFVFSDRKNKNNVNFIFFDTILKILKDRIPYVQVYVHVYICVLICMYMFIYVNICIYTHKLS